MNDPQVLRASIRAMPNASDTPAAPSPFYIQSNIGASNWVVAATLHDGKRVARIARKTGSLEQLWLREEDPRGGCYLTNVGRQLVLTWHGRGLQCTLETKDESDPHQLWVPSPFSNWIILSAPNTNQALNVFGKAWDETSQIGLWEWSEGLPNEIWQLNAEHGPITVESMTYDMTRARVSLDVPPSVNAGMAVDNMDASLEMETTLQLERRATTSRRISYDESSSNSLRLLTSIGFSAGFDKIVEVKGSVATESTSETRISYSDTTTHSTMAKDSVKAKVKVPPHARFEFAILVHYGRVDVPYTAVVARALPNNRVERTTLNGTFSNVSMVRYEIVGSDITHGRPKHLSLEAPTTEAETLPA